MYSKQRLTARQVEVADLIVNACQAAGVKPEFMLALAVTESSLNPAASGDDGKSFGLFQETLATAHMFEPTLNTLDLFDAAINARIGCAYFLFMVQHYPGHSYGDYAEAWTLGLHGRFDLGRRNTVKLANMHRAIADLDLDLSLEEVPS